MTKTRAIFVVVIAVVGLARFALPARSSVLSPGTTQRLTVYGGVVTITPGDTLVDGVTQRTLELGTSGTTIASNDDIILQPGNTSTTSTKFVGVSGNIQNVTISGSVSMETNGKEVCLRGVCRTSWSRVAEHWQALVLSYGAWQQTILQPRTLSEGVRIGTATQQFSNGTALVTDGLFATNRAGGNAANFSGNISNISNLQVYDTILVNYREPWSERLQGEGTGLDADKLDGAGVLIRSGFVCNATACLCFYGTPTNHTNITFTTEKNGSRCIRLFASPTPPY